MALMAKNKAGFVEGKITKRNADDSKFAAWTHCNNKILSWILNATNKTIASRIVFIEFAKEVWQN